MPEQQSQTITEPGSDKITASTALDLAPRRGALNRLQEAYGRYGWRLFFIALYRGVCQWPHLRSYLISLKLRCLLASRIGSHVEFGRDVLVWIPGGYLEIGNDTLFRDRCVIGVSSNPRAEVRIGENCFFASDVHIYGSQEISIGNNVRIAEFTSVRDSSHKYEDRNYLINQQGDLRGRIVIGDDVWIGQGCLLISEGRTLTIGQGAVIAAHSVVKDSIPDYAVAAGSPARVVKHRT